MFSKWNEFIEFNQNYTIILHPGREENGSTTATKRQKMGRSSDISSDFAPFALRDGNLVTGQNPASATRTAELVMDALKDKAA